MEPSSLSKSGAEYITQVAMTSQSSEEYVARIGATLAAFIKLGSVVSNWTPEQQKLVLNTVYEYVIRKFNLGDVTPAGEGTVQ